MKQYVVPKQADAADIKRVRKMLDITQQEFALLVGTSKSTVERWEMGKAPVTGPLVLLLQMIERDPSYVKSLEMPEKQTPLRLLYLYRNQICTLIDVNEREQTVKIHNYVQDRMFCAFGVNQNPSWEDYQNFLESRCFPEGRDKMKLVLRDLDLPFYDPLMIIRKTEGRMAEDDFRIKIQ